MNTGHGVRLDARGDDESGLASLEWPPADVAAPLRALAAAGGFSSSWPDGSATPPSAQPAPASPSGDDLHHRLTSFAERAGLELDARDIPAADPVTALRGLVPAVIRTKGRTGLWAILRVGRRHATLLGPDGAIELPCEALHEALLRGESDGAAAVARLRGALAGETDGGGRPPLSARRRERAARMLLAPTFAGRPIAEAWGVRPREDVRVARSALRTVRGYRRATLIGVGYLAQFALFLGIWGEVTALVASPRPAAVAAADAPTWTWFLIFLAGWVAVQVATSAAVARLALDIGGAVRSTMLHGALRLDPEQMRTAGVGQLLGRALEAEALDALALGGAVEAITGLFEMILGLGILAWGGGPLSTLVVWTAIVVLFVVTSRHQVRCLRVWGDTRRGLTHDLVERMVGHRTVLIQDRPQARSREDDQSLATYDARTRALDRPEILLSAVIPRLWLFLALLTLAPPLWSSSSGVVPAALAVSVAGVWLVYGAWRRWGRALPLLSLAREAWAQLAPLRADTESARPIRRAALASTTSVVRPAEAPQEGTLARSSAVAAPLLALDGLCFQYPGRRSPVLDRVSTVVGVGARILLEGRSGGGKSTLAALLTGLRVPTAGHLSLRGADQADLGLSRWRAGVGGAPQFHDNHVLGTDLLFNLLMGRRWPPRVEDVDDAERVCRELGLGPLLDRMPSGLQQQVGETGWQLSHGERSRLFIARSLLQALEVRVLDESFAALDPETLDGVMAAVLARPEALIVIAHP